jgi:putative oxidoreductase
MRSQRLAADIGLLILRVLPAMGMLFGHGIRKLYRVPGIFDTFSDPIGLGPTLSAILAIAAEVGCAILVALGLFTRWAAVPLVFLLLVAAAIVHADDPWQKKEFALVYAVPFFVLIFTGPGRYSLDSFLSRRRSEDE